MAAVVDLLTISLVTVLWKLPLCSFILSFLHIQGKMFLKETQIARIKFKLNIAGQLTVKDYG